MAQEPAPPAARRIADNSASWPAFAALLAPAADCDCQVLAMTITDQIGPAAAVRSTPPKSAR